MWTNQNTRFICSPGAAAESLRTSSTESNQSAPSKSCRTSKRCLRRASPACRYGTTCEPSAPTIQSAPECSQTYANAATRLSLPGAFRVRIFHAREKARAYAEREADFGRNMRVSFAKFDPVSYSWKIPHFLFQGDLATYSQTWPRWGMMVRGECFQLPPWVQDTGATAFGELSGAGIEAAAESAPWPTVTAKGNGNRSEYGGKSGDGLDTAVKRAGAVSATGPTPTCVGLDGGSNSRKAARARGRYIEGAGAKSATWPTPTAHAALPVCMEKDRDGLNYAVARGKTKSHLYPTVGTQTMGGCSGSFAKLKHLEEIGRQTPEECRAMSSHLTGGKDPAQANVGLLNPDWVEWLMGWPYGWTDIDKASLDELAWLDLSDDPAEWLPPLMPRITTRKEHRTKRIETLGNGQVPLCAAVAFIYGMEILRVALKRRKA